MADLQTAEPQSVDDLLGISSSREVDKIKGTEIPTQARRLVVASFITRALMWLFVGQMAVITLLHAGVVIATGADKAILEQSTNAVLEGVRTIVPVTTTLLGVAIGYYFRSEIDGEKPETPGSPPPSD